MNIPVFIDSENSSQLAELRSYLKSKNILIEEDAGNVAIEESLVEVIKKSEKLWKDVNDSEGIKEIEQIYNSIISLIFVFPRENIETPTLALCQVLNQALPVHDKRNISKLKLLNHLFIGLENNCPLKYNVCIAFIQLAGKAELLVNVKLEDIKAWSKNWNGDVSKYQSLLRVLHGVFLNAKLSEKASKVMIELLGTYNEDNAAQAREDARRCIVTCIADPSVFLLDHLLLLKPVKFLEGELIHDLITIFVTGKLVHYLDFYENHKDVVESNGLNHENNIKKMRLLTFLSLAEVSDELTYDIIIDELKLKPEQVESFIIDVIKSKAAQVKIIQTQRKVVVSCALNRTFGRAQWLQLQEKLSLWSNTLDKVSADIHSVSYVM